MDRGGAGDDREVHDGQLRHTAEQAGGPEHPVLGARELASTPVVDGLGSVIPQDIEMTNYVELGMRGGRPRPGRSRGAVLRVRRSSRFCLCRLLAPVFVVLFRVNFQRW